jgi:acyl-coenzyme A synthetase/AMP-(fatty) acid ligase
MSLHTDTVLSAERRALLAGDPAVGGGNVLRSAIAAHPHPDLPFLRSARPLINTDGQEQSEFSLLQLDQLAQSWSVWYLEQGVRPRDRVAVYLEDSFAYSVHFHALAQIGAIALLINSNASGEIARSLCEQTSPVGLFAGRARLSELGLDIDTHGLRWIKQAEDTPAPSANALPDNARFRHAAGDPIAILHSSGTTGRPKPTIHTHQSIVAGPKFRLVDDKGPAGALTMTALPQSHLGCIAYTTFALLAGAHTLALRDSTGIELAAAVRAYQPTAVMSFPHAYADLAALTLPDGAVDSVNAWISIGDAVHWAHIRSILGLRSAGLPPSVFLDRLGTTELGWGGLLKTWTLESERKDRCAGTPTGVAEVVVLTDNGTETANDEIGLLGAMGPAVTPGYWNNSDLTYRSMLAGYWLTGDHAYRDKNGDHFLVDRAADAIQTPTGIAFSVFMEETMLADVPGVLDCAVVSGRHGDRDIPVAVVTTSDAHADPEKLLRMANDALRIAGHPELGVLEIARSGADLPLGVTGKVLKRVLRQKYGSLDNYVASQEGKMLAADIAD